MYDLSNLLTYYINHDDFKSQGLYLLVDENAPVQQSAFVVKKGRNDELLVKINKGLEQIKADGTYDKIHAKWFGSSATGALASATASTASLTK